MPNNLDMGGFGSPGLPVLSALSGAATVDSAPSVTTLQEWRFGGARRISFGSAGVINLLNGTTAFTDAGIATAGGHKLYGANNALLVAYAGTAFAGFTGIGSGGVTLRSSSIIGWASGTPDTNTWDLQLFRDATATLAMRNSTVAQTYRVYGTYTDASNYVRASLSATSTAVTLAAETAGTGADNVPVILTPAGASQVEVGNGVQFTEMTAPSAPAANKVILYAVDNGAGKTQLMALFSSGAAQVVATEP